MKLELKHLVAYLPYNLKVTRNGFIGDLIALMNDEDSIAENFEFKVSCSNWWENNTDKNHYKPILRPLSDLTKEIEVNGKKFVPIEKINDFMPLGRNFGFSFEIDNLGNLGYRTSESWLNPMLHYDAFQKLLEWHFDIYGLIEAGLAIDVNTLNSEL